MKHTIEFETGETTCAVEPGKFCQFCYAKNFGTMPWCHLLDEKIYEKDGWLQRTYNCMERFPNET
jgi:hypothetical protein